MTFCYNEGRATEQADLMGGRLWCMIMFVHCGLWYMTVHCGLWCRTVCPLWTVVYDYGLWCMTVHCGLWCMTVDCGV